MNSIEFSYREWLVIFLEKDGLGVLLECLGKLSNGLTVAGTISHLQCVACLRTVTKSQTGLNFISNHHQYSSQLASVLLCDTTTVKLQVFELLCALCVFSEEGHQFVLQVLRNFEVEYGKHRYEVIISELKASNTLHYSMILLAFVNCVIISEEDTYQRLYIRQEFIELGLRSILEEMRDYDDDDLQIQLKVFHENECYDSHEFDLISHQQLFAEIMKKVSGSSCYLLFHSLLRHILKLDLNANDMKRMLEALINVVSAKNILKNSTRFVGLCNASTQTYDLLNEGPGKKFRLQNVSTRKMKNKNTTKKECKEPSNSKYIKSSDTTHMDKREISNTTISEDMSENGHSDNLLDEVCDNDSELADNPRTPTSAAETCTSNHDCLTAPSLLPPSISSSPKCSAETSLSHISENFPVPIPPALPPSLLGVISDSSDQFNHIPPPPPLPSILSSNGNDFLNLLSTSYGTSQQVEPVEYFRSISSSPVITPQSFPPLSLSTLTTLSCSAGCNSVSSPLPLRLTAPSSFTHSLDPSITLQPPLLTPPASPILLPGENVYTVTCTSHSYTTLPPPPPPFPSYSLSSEPSTSTSSRLANFNVTSVVTPPPPPLPPPFPDRRLYATTSNLSDSDITSPPPPPPPLPPPLPASFSLSAAPSSATSNLSDSDIALPPPPPPPPPPPVSFLLPVMPPSTTSNLSVSKISSPPPPPPPPPASFLQPVMPSLTTSSLSDSKITSSPPPPPPPNSSSAIGNTTTSSFGDVNSVSSNYFSEIRNKENVSQALYNTFPRAKMKTINWTKISNNTIGNSMWAMANESSISLKVDIDKMQELFCQKKQTITKKKEDSNSIKKVQLLTIIDSRRSLSTNIFLKQFKQGFEEILRCITNGSGLNVDKLRGLKKILPDAEDLKIVRSYKGDVKMLDVPEQFFLRLLEIQDYKLIIDIMLQKEECPVALGELKPALQSLLDASNRIIHNDKLKQFLSLVLQLGNQMNAGTYAGHAAGFKINSLPKLSEIRSNKPKITFLHYAVEMALKNFNDSPLLFTEDSKLFHQLSRTPLSNLEEEVKMLSSKMSNLQTKLNVSQNENLISKYKDFVEFTIEKINELDQLVHDVKNISQKLAVYFCEEPTKFVLEECFQLLGNFYDHIKQAVTENEQIQRQELIAIKNASVIKPVKKSKENQSNKENEISVVDLLMQDIKKGSFNLRRTA